MTSNTQPEPEETTDSARLEWLHSHDAGFGHTCHVVLNLADNALTDSDTTFVRVPCRYLYEWHCYDGATWRDAIDAAMVAPDCKGEDGQCGSSNSLREDAGELHRKQREDERLRIILAVETLDVPRALVDKVATLRAALDKAEKERDEITESHAELFAERTALRTAVFEEAYALQNHRKWSPTLEAVYAAAIKPWREYAVRPIPNSESVL